MKAALKKGYDYSGNRLFDNPQFNHLLSIILEFDPERRASPEEILACKFLNEWDKKQDLIMQ